MASEGNAALVRRFYDAFNSEELDAFAATLADGAELQTARGLRRGVEEAREWATRTPTGHLHQRIEVDDVLEHGDHAVALVRKQWRWRDSGELADEEEMAALFTIRDRRIERWQPFTDRAEALRAAGIQGGD